MMKLEVPSLGSFDCMGNSSDVASMGQMEEGRRGQVDGQIVGHSYHDRGGEGGGGGGAGGGVVGGAVLDGRRHDENYFEGCPRISAVNSDELAQYFSRLFEKKPSSIDTDMRKDKKKSKKMKRKSSKSKEKLKAKMDSDIYPSLLYNVTIPRNPSPFAVFAAVRSTCLETQHRHAALLQLQTSTAWRESPSEENSDHPEHETSSENQAINQLPKVVGIGINGVLEIIRDCRFKFPSICQKALESLHNILQGLSPEELAGEPPEVMESLFDTLMELASLSSASMSETEESQIRSAACACLLSFVVSYGDTSKILRATSSLLMSPRSYGDEKIQMPSILVALQRSIVSVMIGRLEHPDFMNFGVPSSSLVDSFVIDFDDRKLAVQCSASDGRFLYVQTEIGLFQIGTGYCGTIKGQVYHHHKNEHEGNAIRWIGFVEDSLYAEHCQGDTLVLYQVNKTTLQVEKVMTKTNLEYPYVMFSDGTTIGYLTLSAPETFVLKYINPDSMTITAEFPLKLARKRIDVFGAAASFLDDGNNKPLDVQSVEEDCVALQTGKDFALALSSLGKIYYTGKPSSVGFKQSSPPSGQWNELSISQSPRIIQFAIGHDGLHSLLLSEDGSVYFTGTARRGEDGDSSKTRKQPKPVKPKKMTRIESYVITQVACNNGTSAVVTKEGELFVFGKDAAAHCDYTTGQVMDLKGIPIIQTSVGKAHIVALTDGGQVYTFGMNSKGQCGRGESTKVEKSTVEPVVVDASEDISDVEVEQEGLGGICETGKHTWKRDYCMVCTVCGECTGYGPVCVSSIRPDRNPGVRCGCGPGDSGCIECGCCRLCAGESNESDVDGAAGIVTASAAAPFDGTTAVELLHRDLTHLDLIATGQDFKPPPPPPPPPSISGEYREKLIRRTFHKRHDINRSRQYSNLGEKAKRSNDSFGWKHPVNKAVNIESNDVVVVESPVTTDKLASLPPAKVTLPQGVKIVQISTGHHHTVMLDNKGDVYTFGNNFHGQLGVHDLLPRNGVCKVEIPDKATSVSAGSYHSLILTRDGRVYSFGMYQRGQLCREEPETCQDLVGKHLWFAFPGLVPRIGPQHGRIATWIGTSGDQSFIKVNESLIHSQSLHGSSIVADRKHIFLFPPSPNNIVINRTDGSCRSFNGPEHEDLSRFQVALDPHYHVMWAVSKNQVYVYHPLAPLFVKNEPNLVAPNILSPELSLPMVTNCTISRNQASLNMLSCLDTLTQKPNVRTLLDEEARFNDSLKTYSRKDFNVVNRFESHGGGWGYSGSSVEAIRFSVDTDILVGGFGVFGGRGIYMGEIKLFDIGFEGGEQELDGEELAKSDLVTYQCESQQPYSILFEDPITIQSGRWYLAWARISGSSSDCGSSGQTHVTTDDQVQFQFKSSKKSNNGTDESAGQIPQILYKVCSHHDSNQSSRGKQEDPDPTHILSTKFARTVTPDCFTSLLALLRWSWTAFKAGLSDLAEDDGRKLVIMDLQRLIFICRACLRLMIVYVELIYPVKRSASNPSNDTVKFAEKIYDVRMLLQQILTDSTVRTCEGMTDWILKDAHRAFVACFQAFFPTGHLKWACLCNLLTLMDQPDVVKYDRLLTAVLDSLCNPLIRLRNIFPITYSLETESSKSPENNLSLANSMIQGTYQRYPVLTETMNFLCHDPEFRSWTFRQVLDRLLTIGTLSVMQKLKREDSFSPKLVEKSCRVISSVISELANQTILTESDIQSIGGRILHSTPNRFSRAGGSRSWNTGNGSPDAICFSVDKPGIFIVGCCVYGGIGTHDYELELLSDQGGIASTSPPENVGGDNEDVDHSQRWNSMEITHGSYSYEDCFNNIAELKFQRIVSIRPHVKYSLRLRNHGNRTSNGYGGLSSVKGPDGTTFSFYSCSLSFNGTNPTRGQLPQILYFNSLQETDVQSNSTKSLAEKYARRTALSTTDTIVKAISSLFTVLSENEEDRDKIPILNRAPIVNALMPHILASISPLAVGDPSSAVQVLRFVQDLLPLVVSLNEESNSNDESTKRPHYAWVESSHPYKSATISHSRVVFPESVKWMSIEFDSQCCTSQPEDSLQLFIRNPKSDTTAAMTADTISTTPTSLPSASGAGAGAAAAAGSSLPKGSSSQASLSSSLISSSSSLEVDSSKYAPVLKRFHGSNWPKHSIILPGNEILFSLETASDYVKADKADQYGFRCFVVGYEDGNVGIDQGLKNLERELAYLGGLCSASLMKKDLTLTQVEDMDLVDEAAAEAFDMHPTLLSKGLALCHPLTIQEALDGVLPYSHQSPERIFLRNFVHCASDTAGGRLARWLQPESYVDVNQCRVLFSKEEDFRCNWPNIITVITRDQYGEVVLAPAMKVEVRAVPVEGGQKTRKTTSELDPMTFGGHQLPNLDTKYEVTVKDKMFYHSITVQKCYNMYSFEELRFASPTVRRQSENMLVRPNNDGTYSANWTPGHVGWYQIHVTIDGCEIQESYKVQVFDPPIGILPPGQQQQQQVVMSNGVHETLQKGNSSSFRSTTTSSRIRQFKTPSSSGLRVRIHPTFQSEQIGIVPIDGILTIIDEVQNSDGVWVRLSTDSLLTYAPNQTEGWCLQYNQHLHRTLLIPISEKGEKPSVPVKPRRKCSLLRGPGTYSVVKCGASGHNIRSSPSLSAAPIGMLNLGDVVEVVRIRESGNEVWVQLDRESIEKHCLILDGDAWSLAVSSSDVQYLDSITRRNENEDEKKEKPKPSPRRSLERRTPSPMGKPSFFQKWFKGGEPNTTCSSKRSSTALLLPPPPPPPPLPPPSSSGLTPRRVFVNKDIPPELQGVSVKELVKVIGESRANGNGVTPPGTPAAPRRKALKTEESSKRASSSTSCPTTSSSSSSSPAPLPPQSQPSVKEEVVPRVKEALSPSVAESIRSVFAAFVWHENIVADSMEAASFLPCLSKTKSDVLLFEGTSESKSTLQLLSVLWEEMKSYCIHAILQQVIVSSNPLHHAQLSYSRSSPQDRHKRAKVGRSRKEVVDTSYQLCEMCGHYFNQVVTYHMKSEHPGCGSYAGGKGYNSGGSYCGGWAGNCGDGGVGGSSWYLICVACREKYMKAAQITSTPPVVAGTATASTTAAAATTTTTTAAATAAAAAATPTSLSTETKSKKKSSSKRTKATPLLSPNPTVTSHVLMKNNALFLLELAEKTTNESTTTTTTDPFPSIPCRYLRNRQRDEGEAVIIIKDVPDPIPPSDNLRNLFSSEDENSSISDILQRPVMSFVLQWNDLESLQISMTNALRKSACRTYAMQALNWLLRCVSDPGCLHDLFWCFAAALESSSPLMETEMRRNENVTNNEEKNNNFNNSNNNNSYNNNNNNNNNHHHNSNGSSSSSSNNKNGNNNNKRRLFEHPTSDIRGGDKQLSTTFHTLLRTISDMFPSLPPSSSLLQMAITCWAVEFQPVDHEFLYRSRVFPSISDILSKSQDFELNGSSRIETMTDVTSAVEVKVSSRPSMISSLTDGSTETFWESGNEDRYRSKSVSFITKMTSICAVSVHIDNYRDHGYKVSSITFKSGRSSEDGDLKLIKQNDVDSRFVGWITCFVDRYDGFIKVELKGPGHNLRLRQVKLLAIRRDKTDVNDDDDDDDDQNRIIERRNCHCSILEIFRLLSTQILYGRRISQDNDNEISQLSCLQKQVCNDILDAIEREARQEEKDFNDDTYCYEMLNLITDLSESRIGKSYLASRKTVLLSLCRLLHSSSSSTSTSSSSTSSSSRIQKRVILLIRRILSEMDPDTFAERIESNVDVLPTLSSFVSNPQKEGILDVFLSCIAKALTVQIKGSKGSDSSPKTSSNFTLQRRWLTGSFSKNIADEIVGLVRDLSEGRFGSRWREVTKGAVAQNLMNLTKFDVVRRSNPECFRFESFWLTLASICVLDPDHVSVLSYEDRKRNVYTCENHDDHRTVAIIECGTCGNLCGDCDRFLHLNRRRTLGHVRTLFKEEENAVKLDLHEGCGRMKLYWIMILADSANLKAMVEFLDATLTTDSVCRFCGRRAESDRLPFMDFVCADPDCVAYASNACSKTLKCGHFCGGIADEIECLPCLRGCGIDGNNSRTLKQDAHDMCMICFTDALSPVPSVMLECGHIFHHHCCVRVLTNRWIGPRITFGFRTCPICKRKIRHPSLERYLDPIDALYEDVSKKALMRLEYEGLSKCDSVTTPGSRYFQDPLTFALDRYAYYVCFTCSKAYYGGEAQCDVEVEPDRFNPEELVCGACSDVSRAQMCPKHGTDYLEYKCRYCCSVAVFFCFGTTHFCNSCHDDFQRVANLPKRDLPPCPVGPKATRIEGSQECPLHVEHPPTGEEFALGCGICRNAHTF